MNVPRKRRHKHWQPQALPQQRGGAFRRLKRYYRGSTSFGNLEPPLQNLELPVPARLINYPCTTLKLRTGLCRIGCNFGEFRITENVILNHRICNLEPPAGNFEVPKTPKTAFDKSLFL